MKKMYQVARILLVALAIVSMIAACAVPETAPQGSAAPEAAPAAQAGDGAMTDVGTPRNETLIFQTFDRKTNTPDQQNPLMSNYAIWRGFRELGWGYLWETTRTPNSASS